jgi:hypothetical protein
MRLTLKDLLEVCSPDWIQTDKKVINVNEKGIPDDLLTAPVKDITGFDDGLTIEVIHGSCPCTFLPTRKGRKK